MRFPSDLITPPARLTGSTTAVYGPWAIQTAEQLGTNTACIETAVRGFVDGLRFGQITEKTGLPQETLLQLYRMPWMRAVWLVSTPRSITAAQALG